MHVHEQNIKNKLKLLKEKNSPAGNYMNKHFVG